MNALKKGYPTHYALAAALKRKGFVRDMLDVQRFAHPDGAVVRSVLDGRWKVEAVA